MCVCESASVRVCVCERERVCVCVRGGEREGKGRGVELSMLLLADGLCSTGALLSGRDVSLSHQVWLCVRHMLGPHSCGPGVKVCFVVLARSLPDNSCRRRPCHSARTLWLTKRREKKTMQRRRACERFPGCGIARAHTH